MKRLGLVLGVAVVMAMALAVTSASAAPSRFTYEVCDPALPGGNAPGLSTIGAGGPFTAFNECASGGQLGVRETAPAWGTFEVLLVPVPATPGGYVEWLAITASACGMSQGNTNPHVYEDSWPTPICRDTLRYFHVHDGPYPYAPGAGTNVVLNCEALYDGNHNPISCQPGPYGPTVGARYIAATEVDPLPPTVSDVAGSLLAGGEIRGHQTISAKAADKGGGLSQMFVLVNGVRTGGTLAGSCSTTEVSNSSFNGTATASLTPCPASGAGKWTLDTQAYPFRDGANSVEICAQDFSTLEDANQTCSPASHIDVDNSCTPSAVDGGELLSAQFEGSHAETYSAAFGKDAEVRGRLATNADDPVPGATLCVKVGTLGVDRAPAGVGVLHTDANGEYAYKLDPGPNRQVVIGYRHDSHQLAREVRFYSHVKPSLTAAPKKIRNGHSVRMWGELPGPRPGRRVVIVQANVVGSKRWITFRKAITDERGDFKATYRFKKTTRRTAYRFRAVVPTQDSYPWLEGMSAPAKVVVSG
jgi:hypothetical protein